MFMLDMLSKEVDVLIGAYLKHSQQAAVLKKFASDSKPRQFNLPKQISKYNRYKHSRKWRVKNSDFGF